MELTHSKLTIGSDETPYAEGESCSRFTTSMSRKILHTQLQFIARQGLTRSQIQYIYIYMQYNQSTLDLLL